MDENRNLAEESIDLRDLLDIFTRKWKILLFITISCGLIVFLVSAFIITPIYTAQVTMYVNNTKKAMSDSINYNDITASQMLVDSYVEIVKSNTVLSEVAETADLGYEVKQIRKMLNASAVNGTEIFAVSISNENPEHAAKLANTIAQIAPTKILDYVEASSVKVIDYAVAPEQPSSPNVVVNTFIGLIAGFILSVFLVIVLEMFDTRVKDEEDLERIAEIPVIGIIPEIIENENA